MLSKSPTLLDQYHVPEVRRGDHLFCEIRGKVRVGGYTEAPIPWPRILTGGKPVLVLCGDLVEAVKMESIMAVAHWWGVCPGTVRKWRRTLGVERYNPGTLKHFKDSFDKRIPDEAKKRGLATMHSPEARAKGVATKRSRPPSDTLMKALAETRKKPKSDAWKAKASENMRDQWASGKRRHPQAWTEKELALLGTDTDKAVSEMTGRTVDAVGVKRRQLGVKSYRVGQ